jgi:hypothetical protein
VRLHSFACPICGRLREISPRALKAVTRGERSGECRSGEGCRSAVTVAEKNRRWWLARAGVDELAIRRSGGARRYVLEHGLPADLLAMGRAMSAPPRQKIRLCRAVPSAKRGRKRRTLTSPLLSGPALARTENPLDDGRMTA